MEHRLREVKQNHVCVDVSSYFKDSASISD